MFRTGSASSSVTPAQIENMRKRVAEMVPNRAVFQVRNLILSSVHFLHGILDDSTDEGDYGIEDCITLSRMTQRQRVSGIMLRTSNRFGPEGTACGLDIQAGGGTCEIIYWVWFR